MDGPSEIIVSTDLSSLWPPSQSSTTTKTVPTSRWHSSPLTANDGADDHDHDGNSADIPSEHAEHASFFHSNRTGTLLLRTLHSGLVLELLPLSSDSTSPIRFLFPARVLPAPSVLLWRETELHILAVTSSASLCRIVLPLRSSRDPESALWIQPTHANWCREYHIRSAPERLRGIVHVLGPDSVAVALQNGSVLRLHAEDVGDDSTEDRWRESTLAHSSFLSSLTTFLSHPSSGAEASQPVSIAAHPPPSDLDFVWTLSRDRTLRLWTSAGCVASHALPPSLSQQQQQQQQRAVSREPEMASPPPVPLLDPEPQRLLAVFPSPSSNADDDADAPYVLAFVPTPSSATSGGYFQLFVGGPRTLRPIRTFDAPSGSAYHRLQDLVVSSADGDDGRGGTVYTLWDYDGQSVVHSLALTPLLAPSSSSSLTSSSSSALRQKENQPAWRTMRYPYDPSLTHSHLDERLLSLATTSLADTFFSTITRPGTFSPLSRAVALEGYIKALRDLPGPHPPQLATHAYVHTQADVAETIASVVGCGVALAKDPVSGRPMYDRYWTALKRDWESFVARCREAERSARWPLALGLTHRSKLLIAERERVGTLAHEDLALGVHRALLTTTPLEPHFALLGAAWDVRSAAGPRAVRTAIDLVSDAARQEVAYPYQDVVAHLAERAGVREGMDEGELGWVEGRVEGVGGGEKGGEALDTALNLVGGYDEVVKAEPGHDENDDENDGDEQNSGNGGGNGQGKLARALVAAYVSHTVVARHELCAAILVFLLFDAERAWAPALLAEVLAVFRGVAILREIVEEPGAASHTASASASSTGLEDIAARMRGLDVSGSGAGSDRREQSSASLLADLLPLYAPHTHTPISTRTAAHAFMDNTGLLTSTSPSEASTAETLLAERLRRLGRHAAARRVVAWLPRAPAVVYVAARVAVDVGRMEEGAEGFERLAGALGPHSALQPQDAEALAAVMPDVPDPIPSGSTFTFALTDFDLYVHARAIFDAAGSTAHVVRFARRAIGVAPVGGVVDTAGLWSDVVGGCVEMGLWDEAYAAIGECVDEKLRRDATRHLVARMCEAGAVDRLISFSFVFPGQGGSVLADEAIEHLAVKARHGDPRSRPAYSRILYAWYISRADYRNAARVMYQRARKLGSLALDAAQFIELAPGQLESLLAASNALSLVDARDAWFVIPLGLSGQGGLTRCLPEDRITVGSRRDSELVERRDVVREYTLLEARLEIVSREPALFVSAETLLSPAGVVMRLSHAQRFDSALRTACTLKVDMTEVFAGLARECVRLARNPDPIVTESMSDWLLTDKATSWAGSWDARAWRYLREALAQYDGVQTDYAYTKAVFETVCSIAQHSVPPPWLVQTLEDFHPEWLIRTCMRIGMLDLAIEQTLRLIRASEQQVERERPRNGSATWLPYTLIDQLLVATADHRGVSPQATKMRKELHLMLSNRVQRMQKATSRLTH